MLFLLKILSFFRQLIVFFFFKMYLGSPKMNPIFFQSNLSKLKWIWTWNWFNYVINFCFGINLLFYISKVCIVDINLVIFRSCYYVLLVIKKICTYIVMKTFVFIIDHNRFINLFGSMIKIAVVAWYVS